MKAKSGRPKATPLLYTMGHSTLSIEEFIARLQKWEIRLVVDIRTIPQSLRNPQFGQESLKRSLEVATIYYIHMRELGGLKKPSKDSINAGWRNLSFRGYADYMQTPEFQDALGKLIALAKQTTAAIVCAEAVPWRCHRSLVADALVARGFAVDDIRSLTQAKPHVLNPLARVDGFKVTYPESNEES